MNKPSIARFHQRLAGWYAAHGRRDLPWRNTADPYAIYVSETMLQQTQVKTVLERFYFPFLQRFPTLQTLAMAAQDEVLQAWQGLGYYSRARNLHRCAQLAPNGLPGTAEALLALPGIGRNTAHAVAAFAFGQKVAIMEANVKRVLCRIFALTHPSDAQLWDKAHALLDAASPFDYNQAMMDIGALVCTRRAPACGECPASDICIGQISPESYPAARTKAAPPVRRKRIMVLRNRSGQYYATPRASRFLSGLYHFIETDADAPACSLSGQTHAFCDAAALGHIRQQYSHFTLEADVFMLTTDAAGNSWYDIGQLQQLPVSMAEKKILSLLAALP
jgi:A/G-specific adenine glycosylase